MDHLKSLDDGVFFIAFLKLKNQWKECEMWF